MIKNLYNHNLESSAWWVFCACTCVPLSWIWNQTDKLSNCNSTLIHIHLSNSITFIPLHMFPSSGCGTLEQQLGLTWWTNTSSGGSRAAPSLLSMDKKPKPIRTLNHLHTPLPRVRAASSSSSHPPAQHTHNMIWYDMIWYDMNTRTNLTYCIKCS